MVYWLEGVDNKDGMVQSIVMDTSAVLRVHYVHQLLNGVNVISGTAISKKVTAIPYYSWDNRGPGEKMDSLYTVGFMATTGFSSY